MRCPTPLAASMRLPAPMTSMSAIVTPASSRAASAASAPRSMRSLSGYRPNFVIDAPRIQTSRSAIACSFSPSGRLVAELDRLGALVVDAGDRGRQANVHAEAHIVGAGLDVQQVRLDDAAAGQVDDRRHVRRRDARRGAMHDGVAAHLAVVGELFLRERSAAALGARIAAVEVQRPARVASVGGEMRRAPVEHEIIDDRKLLAHAPPPSLIARYRTRDSGPAGARPTKPSSCHGAGGHAPGTGSQSWPFRDCTAVTAAAGSVTVLLAPTQPQ